MEQSQEPTKTLKEHKAEPGSFLDQLDRNQQRLKEILDTMRLYEIDANLRNKGQ